MSNPDDIVIQFRSNPNIFVDNLKIERLRINGVDKELFEYLSKDRIDCRKYLGVADNLSSIRCEDEESEIRLSYTSKAIYHLIIKLIDIENQRYKLEEKLKKFEGAK